MPAQKNITAARKTVKALTDSGRIEPIDSALVRGFLSLAGALDEDPDNAALWREYRAYEQRLRATGETGDDAFAALLHSLSTPASGPAGA